MIKFLRHNTRHHIWFPRGYKGKTFPQLNPIESCSHGANRKRTFNLWEPVWFFRLRQRVFAFAGRHRCPNHGIGTKLLSTWDVGPDGYRTCSCCGSIHFDDFSDIARKALVDDRYAVEGTTKSYKFYVKQPDVINAGYGALKFYCWHLPKDADPQSLSVIDAAAKVSHDRFLDAMKDFKDNSRRVKC